MTKRAIRSCLVPLLIQHYLLSRIPFGQAFVVSNLPIISAARRHTVVSGGTTTAPSRTGRWPPLWLSSSNANDNAQGPTDDNDDDHDDDANDDLFSTESFQKAKEKADATANKAKTAAELEDFDGYMLRDTIVEKWGKPFDVDFNEVNSFGFRSLYLNVMPFHWGRRPFRHDTELDYLCHLQAVVEILQKYKQLDFVLVQIQETDKKPRPGTSPLVAVPLRLDLTPEQVKQISN